MNENYLERLVAVEQRAKSNTKRLDEIDSKNAEQDRKIIELSDIYIALTKMDGKVENIEKICSTNAQDIKAMKEKPSKRLDMMWGYLVSAIVAGLITYTFTVLGLR